MTDDAGAHENHARWAQPRWTRCIRRLRRPLIFGVAVCILIGGLALAYRPAYAYYRRAIADCVMWSNSYALSVQHFTESADEAGRALTDGTPASVQRLRAETGEDTSRSPAVFGAADCAAHQWPRTLHDKAESFRRLTVRSETRIAKLHKDTDAAVERKLAHDPQAVSVARTRLNTLVADIASSGLDGGMTDGALSDARHLIGTPGTTLGDYRDAQDRLLAAADRAVREESRSRGIDCADPATRCIALTFDDGPDPATTPQVIEALEHAKAARGRETRATFFAIGGKVGGPAQPIIRRAAGNGFQYGSHTWSHIDLPTAMDSGVQERELDASAGVIARTAGRPVDLVRPPHGAVDERSRDYIADRLGAALALYDVDSYDWSAGADERSVKEKVLAQVRPGSIILMHDIQRHTAAVLPDLLRELGRRGYTLVTIPELIGEYPRPGAIYYSRDDILRM